MSGRVRVLERFGVTGAPLGQGAEAWVYPFGDGQVLRIPKPRSTRGFDRRTDLLDRLAEGARRTGIAIPEVLETGRTDDQPWSIERRILGVEMGQALAQSPDRTALIAAYMKTAAQVGDLLSGDDFRELWAEPPLSADTGPALLSALASRSLTWAGIKSEPAPPEGFDGPPELVHLDYFPGNVMADGVRITGVLDFGFATILADRRLTPLVAAISLRFRSDATDAELAGAEALAGAEDVSQVRRWLAAYWSFAIRDDPELARWALPELEGKNAD